MAVNEKDNNGSTGALASNLPVIWIVIGLAGVFSWRIVFSGWVNLIPDECSYWAWSRRLDWSYFDNSGMVAYLIRLSTELFGDHTPFAVRFPFLVISVGSTYLLYASSVTLFGDRSRAILAAFVFNLTPVALLGGSAAIHDNALIFFWMLCLWASARLIKTGDARWFYGLGVFAGLAVQSKYTGILVLPCLLIFLLLSREHRKMLLTKEPWIGVAVSGLFAVPILWWNIAHDWASLHHVLYIGSGSVSVTRRVLDGLGYHAAQFLLVSPLVYVATIAGTVSAPPRRLADRRPERMLLLCLALPLVLFGIMSFKGHVEANWAFMGYLSATILAVEAIVSAGAEGRKGVWEWFGSRYFKWALVVSVVPVVVAVVHAWIGLLPAYVERKLDKADRIIWETRGWDGLGKHVKNLALEGEVIAADSYQLCALLEFNVPGNPYVRYLAPWKRPTQFDVWEPSFDNLAGRTILFVSPKPLVPSSPGRTSIYESFSTVETLEAYRVMYHGVPVREIHVFRCKGFDPYSPVRLGPRSLFYRE